MRKTLSILLSLITALLVVAVPLAAQADDGMQMKSTVFYKDGILYAYDFWGSDRVTLHIPDGVKVYGQMVTSGRTKTFSDGEEHTAKFTPVTAPGSYSPDNRGGFGLIVAALSGTGDVVADIGSEKKIIHIDSTAPEKPVIKFPDFTIKSTLPYDLTATGNIVLARKSTEGGRDTWSYRPVDGGLLDGTMHLSYRFGSGEVAYGFPFCPASAQAWLDKVKKTPGPPPKPPKQPEQPTRPGRSSLPAAPTLGALLAGAAWLTRRKWLPLLPPFRAVYVSLSLQETAPGTVAVTYEPKRGPKQVTAQLRAGTGIILAEITLLKGETRQVELPPGFAGTVTAHVQKYRNLSKNKSIIIDSAGPA